MLSNNGLDIQLVVCLLHGFLDGFDLLVNLLDRLLRLPLDPVQNAVLPDGADPPMVQPPGVELNEDVCYLVGNCIPDVVFHWGI